MDLTREYILPDSIKELDQLIGLKEIKDKARLLYEKALFDSYRGDFKSARCPNYLFVGNPGTGKTTVARLFGRILKDCNIIRTDKVIMADREALVAEYVGQTARKTKQVCREALDGVLFIDEAYSLISRSQNDYGREAISTLIKEMEDHKDRLVVIFAGYTDLMDEFLRMNPGIQSRINDTMVFRDYTEDELSEIAQKYCKRQGFELTEEGMKAFRREIFRRRYSDRFGNARDVEQILETAFVMKARAFFRRGKSEGMDHVGIGPECFPKCALETEGPEKYLKELDQMVGLEGAKRALKEIIDDAVFTKEEIDKGYISNEEASVSRHYCFLGNPGTGKTTVARIFGKVLNAYGITKSDVFIEASRSDLVAAYCGQTAMKTKSLCEKAYGGILFIDEAYAIVQGQNDQFGQEALATLIKEMEDNRDKLIVILAGYKREMEEFLDANSGMRSRITDIIEFADYTENELFRIFLNIHDAHDAHTAYEAQDLIRAWIHRISEARNEQFGNGREMRKLFESIYAKTKSRVVREHITDRYERHQIRAVDVA